MNSIKHVAIIMDGNGRWGEKKNKSRNIGHKAGLKSAEKIILRTIKHKINYLTLYAFSTENWKRPTSEINYLLQLLQSFLIKKIEFFIKNKIKIKFIGNKNKFSKKIINILNSTEKKTKNNKILQLNIALNYGSKAELIYAVKKILKKKVIIKESNIANNLFTAGMPDPDLLIRTGNTKRLSNYLLWQLAYSEIFFEKKLWPDFNEKDYDKVLKKYKKIKRNFGNI